MQLSDPGLTSVLNWGIQEDNLVLDPDFMDDRLQDHVTFQKLHKEVSIKYISTKMCTSTYLFFLNTLVLVSFERQVSRGQHFTSITIISAIELRTPDLDDVCQPLKKDSFYPFVELCNPLFQVSIALQVQAIYL